MFLNRCLSGMTHQHIAAPGDAKIDSYLYFLFTVLPNVVGGSYSVVLCQPLTTVSVQVVGRIITSPA